MHWLRQSVPLLFRRCVEGSGALDEAALKVGEGTGAPESDWMVKSVDVELNTVERREKKPRQHWSRRGTLPTPWKLKWSYSWLGAGEHMH